VTAAVFTRRDALRGFVVEGPLTTIIALAALALAWQIGALVVDEPWLPTFSATIERVAALFESGQLTPILVTSVTNLAVGYAISLVLGTALGAAMALSRPVNYALRALVDALLFVPPVLYAPLVLAFMGFSDLALITVIVLFSTFVITASTQTAISGVDESLRDMAHSFGAGRAQMLRDIILPGAMPQIFAGYRLGMGRAVKGMIIGELFVTVVGLGALERRFSSAFDAVGVWAIAVIVIGLAVLCIWAVQAVDRALNWWAG
jgi:NitT/TauT family transport system permease protein